MLPPRALGALVAVALVSCGPAAPPDAIVELSDRAIRLDRPELAAGPRVLSIHNAGSIVHELVLFRTDLPEDSLPQEGEHLKLRGKVAEKEHIKAGSTRALSLDVSPGRYVLVCDLPGHYAVGMHAALTVR